MYQPIWTIQVPSKNTYNFAVSHNTLDLGGSTCLYILDIFYPFTNFRANENLLELVKKRTTALDEVERIRMR